MITLTLTDAEFTSIKNILANTTGFPLTVTYPLLAKLEQAQVAQQGTSPVPESTGPPDLGKSNSGQGRSPRS